MQLLLALAAILLMALGLYFMRRLNARPEFPRAVTLFKTSDGQFFEDPEDADEHQTRINNASPSTLD